VSKLPLSPEIWEEIHDNSQQKDIQKKEPKSKNTQKKAVKEENNHFLSLFSQNYIRDQKVKKKKSQKKKSQSSSNDNSFLTPKNKKEKMILPKSF
jgi:hypothetical protein